MESTHNVECAADGCSWDVQPRVANVHKAMLDGGLDKRAGHGVAGSTALVGASEVNDRDGSGRHGEFRVFEW